MEDWLKRLRAAWDGRAHRGEFWLCLLGYWILLTALVLLVGLTWADLLTLGLWLFIAGRRLHDFNASAWWAVAPAVISFTVSFAKGFLLKLNGSYPVLMDVAPGTVVVVVMLVIGIVPGTKGANRFGEPNGRLGRKTGG